MDVKIIVPTGSDISKIEAEYPDIYFDDADDEGKDVYYAGSSSAADGNDRDSKNEWFTYDEAIECCGFVEGLMTGAETLIEGCGDWAMSKNRDTDIYRTAFKRGELCR